MSVSITNSPTTRNRNITIPISIMTNPGTMNDQALKINIKPYFITQQCTIMLKACAINESIVHNSFTLVTLYCFQGDFFCALLSFSVWLQSYEHSSDKTDLVSTFESKQHSIHITDYYNHWSSLAIREYNCGLYIG